MLLYHLLWFLFFCIVFLVALDIAVFVRSRIQMPYEPITYFLDPAQQAFLQSFEPLVEDQFRVYANVPALDIINLKGIFLGRKLRQRALQRLDGSYFDFLVCEQDSSLTVGGINFARSGWQEKRRAKRLERVCHAAKFKLVTVESANNYTHKALRDVASRLGLASGARAPARQSNGVKSKLEPPSDEGEPRLNTLSVRRLKTYVNKQLGSGDMYSHQQDGNALTDKIMKLVIKLGSATSAKQPTESRTAETTPAFAEEPLLQAISRNKPRFANVEIDHPMVTPLDEPKLTKPSLEDAEPTAYARVSNLVEKPRKQHILDSKGNSTDTQKPIPVSEEMTQDSDLVVAKGKLENVQQGNSSAPVPVTAKATAEQTKSSRESLAGKPTEYQQEQADEPYLSTETNERTTNEPSKTKTDIGQVKHIADIATDTEEPVFYLAPDEYPEEIGCVDTIALPDIDEVPLRPERGSSSNITMDENESPFLKVRRNQD